MTFKDVWNLTVANLKDKVSAQVYSMWISTLKPIAYENNAAVLVAADSFERDIIMARYKDTICAALAEVVGFDMDLEIKLPEELKKEGKKIVEIESSSMESLTRNLPHHDYSFDNFVVGDSNRHAYAAASAVASNPNGAYNPLFIYGSSGLGKTHLLYAIENKIAQLYPEKKTLYITSEDMLIEFTDHLQKNTMPEFKAKYRNLDVLIVDDIQFIAGKESVMKEFYFTFNALHERGKQIVLVSDRPPRDIQSLEDRLRSRFEMGLTVDIIAPDFDLKVAIIRQLCAFNKLELDYNLISYIAQNVKSNIRQIEGVINNIMALRLVSQVTPNMAVVQAALKNVIKENQPLPQLIDKILVEVAHDFEVSVDDICSKKRNANINLARQTAMYLMRELTDMSLPDIGQHFSNRDHSTVHHSIQCINDLMKTTPSMKIRIEDLMKNIKEN